MEQRFLGEIDPLALLELSNSDSDLDDASSEPGTSLLSVDDFEHQLIANYPEIALELCEIDRGVNKSKNAIRRERESKLAALASTRGRELFDVKKVKLNLNTTSTAVQFMHTLVEGPLALLTKALRSRRKVEIRMRAHHQIDRIVRGVVTAFDYHMNIIISDAVELFLPGKLESRRKSKRKFESVLPELLQWQIADNSLWPLPIGNGRLVYQRSLMCSLIKGDTIVLVSFV